MPLLKVLRGLECGFHFGLVWNEIQSFFLIETDARRNHDMNENYKLLLIIPCIIKLNK